MNRHLSLLSLLALGLAACTGKDSDDTASDDSSATDDTGDSTTDTAPEGTAQLRAIHLSPDAPAVDIFVNGGPDPVATDLSFSDGTPYLEVPAGVYDLQLAPAGQGIGAAFTLASGVELAAGTAWTAVAYNTLDRIAPMALQDDAGGLDAANIRVRVTHTAVGVGEVDVYELSNPAAPALLLENVPFGASAVLPDLPAGAYVIGLDVDDDGVHDVRYDLPALPGGTWVNVFAAQATDGAPYLVAQLPDGATPEVEITPEAWLRVLHLGPDAPEVDVFVEGLPAPLAEGVGFKEGTAYLRVPAATWNIDVSAAGTGPEAAVLEVDGLSLSAGAAYTAVAYGYVSSLRALALVDDAAGLASDKVRIQVSHAAADVGEVDLWNLTGGVASPLLTDVPFGATAVLPDLPAAAYTVGIDVDNDANPDLVFAVPALPGGTFANLFAVNTSGGAVSLLAQLPDGTIAELQPE